MIGDNTASKFNNSTHSTLRRAAGMNFEGAQTSFAAAATAPKSKALPPVAGSVMDPKNWTRK
jgi:hypothetical protein